MDMGVRMGGGRGDRLDGWMLCIVDGIKSDEWDKGWNLSGGGTLAKFHASRQFNMLRIKDLGFNCLVLPSLETQHIALGRCVASRCVHLSRFVLSFDEDRDRVML